MGHRVCVAERAALQVHLPRTSAGLAVDVELTFVVFLPPPCRKLMMRAGAAKMKWL